jgi:hypothetical protein
MWKKCADEKQLAQLKFGLLDCQPLALFALCTGASSDPMVLSLALRKFVLPVSPPVE